MSERKQGERLSKVERAQKLAETARLELMGYSPTNIAEAVGVTVTTVYGYLDEIHEEYINRCVVDKRILVARQVEEYRLVKMEAWEAYMRSKLDAESEKEEHALRLMNKAKEHHNKRKDIPGKARRNAAEQRPEMVKVKHIKEKKGRLPASDYLRVINECNKAIRELLGLDEAIKIDVKAEVVDWSVFHVANMPQYDIIDQRINEELKKSAPELLCYEEDSPIMEEDSRNGEEH